MRSIRLRLPVLIVLALLLLATVVSAHYLMRMKMWEIVDESDVILTGIVVGMESSYNGDESQIYTEIWITVDSVMKGTSVASTVIVREAGGTVDSVSEYVTGTSRWVYAEKALVFLQEDTEGNGFYYTTNSTQGKVAIYADEFGIEQAFWPDGLDYENTPDTDSIHRVFDGYTVPLADLIAEIESFK